MQIKYKAAIFGSDLESVWKRLDVLEVPIHVGITGMLTVLNTEAK